MLLFQRADGGDREDALDAEHFEPEDVGAEVELGRKDAVTASVTGEEGDFAAFEIAENESVAGIAERRRDALLMNIGESGHGVQTAAPDDADFRLLQYDSLASRGTSARDSL